jgi:hypothetical protein
MKKHKLRQGDTALHSAGGENIHQQFFGLICGQSLVDNFMEPHIIKAALPKIQLKKH